MVQPRLRIEEAGDVTRVAFPEGVMLDSPTIQSLGQQLYNVVEGDGKKKVIVDFGEVRFMSSQALGVLLALKRKAGEAGAQIVLSRIRDRLFRVFEITNLDKMFEFFGTNEEAFEHFGVKIPPAAQPSGDSARGQPSEKSP